MRQYLQEIGYTDTIIDVRSNRVRSLLGLTINTSLEEPQTGAATDTTDASKRQTDPNLEKFKRIQRSEAEDKWRPNDAMVVDTEASVLATFEFLNEQREGRNQEDGDEDEDEEEGVEDIDTNRSSGPYAIDTETEEVLAEFDFLSTHPSGDQKEGPWGRAGILSMSVSLGLTSHTKVRLKTWSISENWRL